LILLDNFSNQSRINFIFPRNPLTQLVENEDFNRLKIESGGLVYFDPSEFDSIESGKSDIIIEVKDVKEIEKEWDLKIRSAIDTEQNPLNILKFNKKEGNIRIKTLKKLWI
jgi:hypothetical protein